MISWSVEACRASGAVSRIVIVHPPGQKQEAMEAAGDAAGDIPVTCTAGGTTRQESVFLGLEHLEQFGCHVVLIHDGARPWVTPECIRKVVQGAVKYGGAAPVIPIPDAVKQVEDRFIIGHLPRPGLMAVQTPQGFEFPGILSAHRKARMDQIPCIDDTELYCRYIGKVHAVTGDAENRKVTYPSDIRSGV